MSGLDPDPLFKVIGLKEERTASAPKPLMAVDLMQVSQLLQNRCVRDQLDQVMASRVFRFRTMKCTDVQKQEATRCKAGNFDWQKRPLLLQIECATPIILPSPDLPGVGMQHLWVCSSSSNDKGHVTVVSMRTNQPHVIESFRASDSVIVCVEMVPGFATCEEEDAFSQDTVWMGTEDKK